MDFFVVSISLFSFLMAFSIGSNDAANALATSYGSNAAKLIYLLCAGAVFEFLGAYYCSGRVAGTLVSNIIQGIDTAEPLLVEQMMLGTSLSSFIFIFGSSMFGMPVSGTHTVVGALIGAGIAGISASVINWSYLIRVVLSWFISPVLTMALSYILFVTVCYLTLGGKGIDENFPQLDSLKDSASPTTVKSDDFVSQNSSKLSFNAKLMWLTLLSGFATTLVTFMVIFLAGDNKIGITEKLMLPLSFILGFVLCRYIIYKAAFEIATE